MTTMMMMVVNVINANNYKYNNSYNNSISISLKIYSEYVQSHS